MSASNRRTIWLTGATGYLGSHLLRRLIEGNHRVRCLILPGDQLPEALASRVEVVRGDVTRLETFSGHGDGFETLVHCAALTLPNRADRITSVNVEGTANMIRFAQDSGIARFVYISAVSAVYGRKNVYGISKARAEQLVVESGLNWTILRPTMIYGGGGGLHFQRPRWSSARPASFPSQGTVLRDFSRCGSRTPYRASSWRSPALRLRGRPTTCRAPPW